MILLFGSADDPHIQAVEPHLSKSGADTLILDHTARTSITIDIDRAAFYYGTRKIAFRDVDVAWYRSKFDYPRFGIGDRFRSDYVRGVAWHDAIAGLATILADKVVNSYSAIQRSSRKLDQLVVAKGLGLKIPPTLVTTSSQELSQWATPGDDLIVKAIQDATIPDPSAPLGCVSAMTTRVDRDLLNREPLERSRSPTLFQFEIKKAFELRVSIHGRSLFASRINSSERPYMEVDWRYGSSICKYEPFSIDADVERLLRKYLVHYDLFSGQFDLIVDRDGTYWFLECNPQGFWIFLDQEWDYQISQTCAEEILSDRKVRFN